MKFLFNFLCFLVLSTTVQAQEYKVYGTLTDQEGMQVPGATVIHTQSNNGTQTDANGYYELMVPSGKQTLSFNFSAQKPVIKTIEVQSNTELNVQIAEEDVMLDEVLVSAIRVTADAPVTFSNLTAEEIQPRNLGQDIPVLMNYLPSVVTTSDAGAGVGYTGIRVRGSDATRVNVTINGIPYNDAESQGTFWVNMPDFASSTQSLQLQRGVGTSTNGAGAFGASLNLLTDALSQDPYAEISGSIGSFNTRKANIKFSSGVLSDHFEISGRLSRIKSDGYIDRASSDLESYFLQGAYKDENTLIKALVFGGHEITYQSWNGVEDWQIEEYGRTFNSAGAIYDDEGNIVDYYDNEVDDYKQDHFQLHWNQRLNDEWSTNIAIHYTRGRGFFEQYRQDDPFADYGLEPITIGDETVDTTDLVRRRWLSNHFYGTTFSAKYNNDKLEFIGGGAWNKYEGDHFGEIIWARYASNSEIRDRYYNDNSTKTDFNTYGKLTYWATDKLSLYADMQYRHVSYQANGNETGLVDDNFNFFNPKAGVTYHLNEVQNLYFSYARASREPNRNDYEAGDPEPETLNDFELGWRYASPTVKINANTYYMRYKNQLVLTGELNDVGAPLRENVGDSYRLGLEVDATFFFTDKFLLKPNFALSTNKNLDFYTQTDGNLNNLGTTNISYSPDFVAGNTFTYLPFKNLQLSFLSKFVSEQYLGNTDADNSKLDSYFVNDFNMQYTIEPQGFVKSIVLSGLVNNIFDAKYISNGYYYTYDIENDDGSISTLDGTGYYPQAGINFLVGATVSF
ncbi:TonB-dependent receptor [Galbibacter pacificus]|uniref:TonB-dependent receptor n=1 Tax=Galbibacter pacificus TaxID=2996052 RepID=A0ABT6FTC6_9FLAO|nr:TonB-dependent receptor [Galbibacter pacificus]MDG3583053.1 TonB-dependent receptor [Galbibacter pacificus]MDG3586534.1 TonB-dependent receptor [Galbibacter pacificus]